MSEKRQVTQGPGSPQAVYVGGYGHRAAGHNAQIDATDTDREQSGGAERGAGGALRCGKRHRAGAQANLPPAVQWQMPHRALHVPREGDCAPRIPDGKHTFQEREKAAHVSVPVSKHQLIKVTLPLGGWGEATRGSNPSGGGQLQGLTLQREVRTLTFPGWPQREQNDNMCFPNQQKPKNRT